MNNIDKKFGMLSSSADHQKISATAQSIILALASLIIIGGGKLGVEITQEEIVEFSAQAGLAISSLWFVFGVLRKIILRFFKRKRI